MRTLTDLREHYGIREWGKQAPLAVRLLRNVVDLNGCWLWRGATTDGYGRIQVRNGQPLGLTHRCAYELLVGPIPNGLTIDHLCRNRACINPEHLEPVTSRLNTLRGVGVTAENARKTSCVRGHEFTVENTRVSAGRRYCRACVQARRAERRTEQVAA